MRLLLLGSTDLSLQVAERLTLIGHAPVGVVHAPQTFKISYNRQGVTNFRHADLAGWCEQRRIAHISYENVQQLGDFAKEVKAEIGLAAGWYHMVPALVRQCFVHGVLGLHASLLPQLRGGAPLNWAILSGLQETGMTLFELGDGVDDGPVYGQRRIVIGERDDVSVLVRRAEQAALELIEQCLPAIADGTLAARPQLGAASYALQRSPEDGQIDWRAPAKQIDRLVRATTRPYPGAFTHLDGQRLEIWCAQSLDEPSVLGQPGQIASLPGVPRPVVVTGDGVLVIEDASCSGDDAIPLLRKASNRRFETTA